MKASFSTISDAIKALQNGQMVVLVDDEDRENEGDLVMSAEFVTPDAINFMSKYGRGLICMPMSEMLIDKLNLPMMVRDNLSSYKTGFTVSIEAAHGVTTGISAKDRTHTILTAIKDNATSKDLVSPGHIFPLKAKNGGVIERGGQTEGSIDLMKLAGLKPAAVICEIMNDDGHMSRRQELIQFAHHHNLPILTIKDILEYRIKHESLVDEIAKVTLPLEQYGEFSLSVYHNKFDDSEHFSLQKPTKDKTQPPIVRIHSECITGDVFGSGKCDCGSQLHQSLDMISKNGGVLIYLRQEGRGIGLANKIKAYVLQEQGMDTVEANLKLGLPVDKRDYAVAYQILKFMKINSLKLLTNNPEKMNYLQRLGLTVCERIPVLVNPSDNNLHYLKTKKNKLGHILNL